MPSPYNPTLPPYSGGIQFWIYPSPLSTQHKQGVAPTRGLWTFAYTYTTQTEWGLFLFVYPGGVFQGVSSIESYGVETYELMVRVF